MQLLIIGAGPTGIGAAVQAQALGLDWLLVEAGPTAGGMAGSVTDTEGFTWDMGGHVLHSHFASFDKAIADAGPELLYPTRNGWVQMQGQLRRTPIQQHLTPEEMPADLDPEGPAKNLEQYYRNQFGDQLAEDFFIPFQEKMWATPTADIAHDWTSLRNGSAERNVPQIGIAPSIEKVVFPYPKGGTGALWDGIAATLDQDRIRYLTSVSGLDLDAREATFSDGTVLTYEHAVSTMSLLRLMEMAGLPAEPALRVNEVFVVGMGFQGTPPESLADKSWLYNPDRDVPWHRATMLSNYDEANAGLGRWSILFEIGRSDTRVISDAEAAQGCADSLAGLGADLDLCVDTWVRTVPMGYPVPTLDRDATIRPIHSFLEGRGIQSRGRFGGWRYESCNQDYSFAQGVEAVDDFVAGFVVANVLWHPEAF